MKLIEGRNTGIPTILRALKNNGSNAPVFETDEERSFFTITIPVNKEFLLTNKETKKNYPKNYNFYDNVIVQKTTI